MANNNKYINTLKRPPKSDWILLFLFILLSFIYAEASESIYIWLNKQEKDFWMNVIYSFINNKPLINIFICIAIVYLTFLWARKIWQDKDIRLYRTPIAVFGIVILNYKSDIYYANIICNFSYQCFLTIILSSILAIILIKLIREIYRIWKINKQNKEPELKGFSVDDTEIKLEDNRIKYAETLVKKLKNTNLSKESFAVGITGEWGSGKSTFLNTMKKEIEKEDFAEIVEFNPWLCNSPEQVTQDFFATLINELSPKHSTLSRDINKYAKLLNKMAKASLSFFGIDLDLTPSDDSLNKLKENISDKLANLPKKVVILIDDTDRLEGNEIFEILRLIRNTADFKNVIYIATYDKEYVTDVLKGNKIKAPSSYLEKIFQVEVHLLKVEDYELWDTLMEEIEANFSNFNNEIKINYSNFSFNDRELVAQILSNYRQVKRFARQFTAYLDYFNNNNLINNFYIIDLFWLELLQTYDKNTYNILAKNPEVLLYKENKQFHLRDNIPSNIKEYSTKLLNKLFKEDDSEYKIRKLHDNNRNHTNRIRMVDNYDYYFTINKPKMELTKEELDYHLNYSLNKDIANFTRINYIEEIIQIWLYQDKKNFGSIINTFSTVKERNNPNHIKNYIYSLLTLSLNVISSDPVNDIKFSKILNLLRKDKYIGTNLSNTVNDCVQEYFNCKIEYAHYTEKNYKDAENLLTNLSKLLNRIHEKSILNENNLSIIQISIINDKLIENQLINVINTYLSKYKTYTNPNISPQVLDLMDPDKNLSKMFLNCFITKQAALTNVTNSQNQTTGLYVQIAFKNVINYFSNDNNKSFNKPRLIEYNERLKKLGELMNFDSKDNHYRRGIYTMWSTLENLQDENIKTFKEKCFIQN